MIRTWDELIASRLVLTGDEVNRDIRHKQFAAITKDPDRRLRLNYGVIIQSVIHQVDHELMIVVMTGTVSQVMGSTSVKHYVTHVLPVTQYRNAASLGLQGNHRDTAADTLLVSLDKLASLASRVASLAGAIPTALLAVAVDFLFGQAQYWLVPRGDAIDQRAIRRMGDAARVELVARPECAQRIERARIGHRLDQAPAHFVAGREVEQRRARADAQQVAEGVARERDVGGRGLERRIRQQRLDQRVVFTFEVDRFTGIDGRTGDEFEVARQVVEHNFTVIWVDIVLHGIAF